MPRRESPYVSPYKLPVIEQIEIVAAMMLVLLNLGLWGWYIILAAYLLLPDAWNLW